MDRRSVIRQLFLSKPSDYIGMRESECSESPDEINVRAIVNSVPNPYNRASIWSDLGRNLGLFAKSALTSNPEAYGNLGAETIGRSGNYQVVRIGRRTFAIGAGVAGAIAAGAVAYYLVPGFRNLVNGIIDKSPPSIKDLKWEPTRVVNSKVYDGKVSFVAEDWLSDISEAYIDFVPVYPPEIPTEAFPAEDPRSFTLRPNEMPSKTASFSQAITSLKGGKGYQVKVRAKDTAGNVSKNVKDASGKESGSLSIDYVREFENIATNSGINIGAWYYPWYKPEKWKTNPQPPKGTPLLGLYNSQNPLIQSKHIDWATGHGIGFWLASWFGPEDQRALQLFSSPLINDIRIGILYDDILKPDDEGRFNLDDETNQKALTNHIDYLAQTFFSLPQYWKINGRPGIYFYYSRSFYGNLENMFGRVRDISQDYGHKIFIMGDEMGDELYWDLPSEWPSERLKLYDGITSYLMIPNKKREAEVTNDNYEDILGQFFDAWLKSSKSLGFKFIPFATPGFHVVDDPKNLVRDISKFKKRLRVAKEYMDPELKMIIISTFNEWYEDTYVEPSPKEGFAYLQSIKETL